MQKKRFFSRSNAAILACLVSSVFLLAALAFGAACFTGDRSVIRYVDSACDCLDASGTEAELCLSCFAKECGGSRVKIVADHAMVCLNEHGIERLGFFFCSSEARRGGHLRDSLNQCDDAPIPLPPEPSDDIPPVTPPVEPSSDTGETPDQREQRCTNALRDAASRHVSGDTVACGVYLTERCDSVFSEPALKLSSCESCSTSGGRWIFGTAECCPAGHAPRDTFAGPCERIPTPPPGDGDDGKELCTGAHLRLKDGVCTCEEGYFLDNAGEQPTCVAYADAPLREGDCMYFSCGHILRYSWSPERNTLMRQLEFVTPVIVDAQSSSYCQRWIWEDWRGAASWRLDMGVLAHYKQLCGCNDPKPSSSCRID